jgi:hypothetical protein
MQSTGLKDLDRVPDMIGEQRRAPATAPQEYSAKPNF